MYIKTSHFTFIINVFFLKKKINHTQNIELSLKTKEMRKT